MDPISNGDRLMVLLRQRLEERAKTARGKSKAKPGSAREPVGLEAVAALEGAEPRQLRRACVQALMADQFGSGLINDAQFQQVVTQVTDALGEDTGAAKLLDRVIAQAQRE